MPLARRDFMHGVLALPGVASFGLGLQPSFGTSVRSGDELKAALATATPGSTIVLAPGDFGGVDRFELTVPHVTLRASVPLRSTMRAPLEVHADHARIVDLAFCGKVDDNLHLAALAACTDYLHVTANNTEITGCDFSFFPQRAIFIRSGTGAYIHDCTFHDNTNGKITNSHEAIGLGYSNLYSLQSMKARVVNNKLWNLKHDGETISVKTSDNLVEGNEMISCQGGFTQRYGQNNRFLRNISTNSRGIAVGGRGAKIIGNTVTGLGRIAVQAGDAAVHVLTNGVHPQSYDTVVEGNKGLLVVGNQYSPFPAVNTRVTAHSGSVRLVLHRKTTL